MFGIKKAGVQHALQSIWEIGMHLCNDLLKAKYWDRKKKSQMVSWQELKYAGDFGTE